MRASTLEPSLCSRQCEGLHLRPTLQTAFCREFRRALPVCISGGVPMGVRCDACHAAAVHATFDGTRQSIQQADAGQLALEVDEE